MRGSSKAAWAGHAEDAEELAARLSGMPLRLETGASLIAHAEDSERESAPRRRRELDPDGWHVLDCCGRAYGPFGSADELLGILGALADGRC